MSIAKPNYAKNLLLNQANNYSINNLSKQLSETELQTTQSNFLNSKNQFHKKVANVSNLVKKEKEDNSLIVPLLIPLPSEKTWNELTQNSIEGPQQKKNWLSYLDNIVQNHKKAEKSNIRLIYLDPDNVLDAIIPAINQRFDLVKVGYQTIARIRASQPEEFLSKAINQLNAMKTHKKKIYSEKILFRPNCLNKNLCLIQNYQPNILKGSDDKFLSANAKKHSNKHLQADLNCSNSNLADSLTLSVSNHRRNIAHKIENTLPLNPFFKLSIPITLNVITGY